ncbi:MAG: hypothetical protein CR982_00415 [Candidatus Cloacimonadota bacterium]|nr:MAG: hypothetical protein CR982_00415 [Candidatus Cloacimonadota bacterium]PIE78763.1 MAG: hypothetical protein CSA15_06175 [Candidatus Delongbacteria bacterium]
MENIKIVKDRVWIWASILVMSIIVYISFVLTQELFNSPILTYLVFGYTLLFCLFILVRFSKSQVKIENGKIIYKRDKFRNKLKEYRISEIDTIKHNPFLGYIKIVMKDKRKGFIPYHKIL